MGLTLIVERGGSVQRFVLGEGEHLVGAAGSCTIVLADPTVSRRHARLTVRGGTVSVEDLGSRNGTRIRERRLAPGTPETVVPGEALFFGRVGAVLGVMDDEDARPAVAASAGVLPETPRTPRDETADLSSLGDLLTRSLPGLLDALARCPDASRLQRVCASLWETLPLVALEARKGAGVVFRSRKGEKRGFRRELTEGGYQLAAEFTSQESANLFGPLLGSVWSLAVSPGPEEAPPGRSSGPPPSHRRPPGVPSVDPAMAALTREAAVVADSDLPVLVTGESGTGKEIMARWIHAASPRWDGPFVALNCAALPRELMEAELFGVERGVATGVEARPGHMEMASGGTLFLDEIGDMAPEVQAKLLRFLQSGEVLRLGARRPLRVDVRVVAATNRDLEALVREGTFRADLYHRLVGWVCPLPPLRERRADIPNLAAAFLGRAMARRGRVPGSISAAALEVLQAYPWPGNVRELELEMERAALFLHSGGMLTTAELAPRLLEHGTEGAQGHTLRERLEAEERRAIVEAVRGTATLGEAAELLGVSRTTLYRKMKALGLEPPEKEPHR